MIGTKKQKRLNSMYIVHGIDTRLLFDLLLNEFHERKSRKHNIIILHKTIFRQTKQYKLRAGF